jgi:hypothetical protein
MIRALQVLSFSLGIVAAVFAVRAHRRAPSGPARWSARAALLVSLGVLAATAPAVLLPTLPWVEWTGILADLILAAASFAMWRRQLRVSGD